VDTVATVVVSRLTLVSAADDDDGDKDVTGGSSDVDAFVVVSDVEFGAVVGNTVGLVISTYTHRHTHIHIFNDFLVANFLDKVTVKEEN